MKKLLESLNGSSLRSTIRRPYLFNRVTSRRMTYAVDRLARGSSRVDQRGGVPHSRLLPPVSCLDRIQHRHDAGAHQASRRRFRRLTPSTSPSPTMGATLTSSPSNDADRSASLTFFGHQLQHTRDISTLQSFVERL